MLFVKNIQECPIPNEIKVEGSIFKPDREAIRMLQSKGQLNIFNLAMDGLISFTDGPILQKEYQIFKDAQGQDWALNSG